MFNIQIAGQQLMERQGYRELVDTANRELVNKNPDAIGPIGRVFADITGTVGGGTVGGGVAAGAAYLLGFMSAPVGLSVIAFIGGSTIAGGLAGGVLADNAVQRNRENAKRVAAQIEDVVKRSYAIQLEYNDTKREPISAIEDFVKVLRDNYRFLKRFDQFDLEFNEKRLNEIGSWYPQGERNTIIKITKIIVIVSLSSFPERKRPTPRLIEVLNPLVRDVSNQVMKNIGNSILGSLYTGRENKEQAIHHFGLIPRGSDLYDFAQAQIRALSVLPINRIEL